MSTRRDGGRRPRNLGRLLLLGVAAVALQMWGAPGRAHMPEFHDTVHFNSAPMDFGTPPRRAAYFFADGPPLRYSWDDWDEPGPVPGMELNDAQYTRRREAREKLLSGLTARARNAVRANNWARARAAYEELGRRVGWTGELRDRVEVLRKVEGSLPLSREFAAKVHSYLDAVDTGGQNASPTYEALYSDKNAGFLREHALYQKASVLQEWFDYPGAVTLFRQLLKEFPRGEKREAALIMIARCTIFPETSESQDLKAGRGAIAALLKEFPATRFRRSLPGLRARMDLLEGRIDKAIDAYLALGDISSVEIALKQLPREKQGPHRVRLLGAYMQRLLETKDKDDYARSLRQVDRIRKEMDVEDAHLFSQALLGNPALASPYFYYRLYHCINKPRDLDNLTQLADAIARRYGRAAGRDGRDALSPRVQVRLAEVYYQRRQYDKAEHWAGRAVERNPFDRAYFVRAATRNKRHDYRNAIRDYETLLKRYPNSLLRRAAREDLALAYEGARDYRGALEQYLALGYNLDYAYLLDVRLTTAQIERLLRDRTLRGNRHLIAFSLGVRYMREERWAEAERRLRSIPRKVYAELKTPPQGSPGYDQDYTYDPLRVVRDLRGLYGAAKTARSRSARAAALYKVATYYYTHGTLLLYNPALWKYDRSLAFCVTWERNGATSEENAAVRKHMFQHEVYYRTQEICLKIAREYPRAPVTPQALYRAACCARKLNGFNDYWSRQNTGRDWGREAASLMKRVAHRYPRSPFAAPARKYADVFDKERRGIY